MCSERVRLAATGSLVWLSMCLNKTRTLQNLNLVGASYTSPHDHPASASSFVHFLVSRSLLASIQSSPHASWAEHDSMTSSLIKLPFRWCDWVVLHSSNLRVHKYRYHLLTMMQQLLPVSRYPYDESISITSNTSIVHPA